MNAGDTMPRRPASDPLAALRAVARGTAEGVVAATGVDRLGRWVRHVRAMVLAYHNVIPDELAGQGDSSLHLPLSVFRRQLDLICNECQPLPLMDLVRGNWTPQRGRPALAITFDDAYRGALALALPELAERDLTATVFVAPALLDDRTLWWDGLATGRGGELDPDLRSRILERGNGRWEDARQLAATAGALWQEMPDMLRTGTEAELARAVTNGGCTVGSHTWSHASLTSLDAAEAAEELARPRSWLQERYGDAYVDAVSYPFGNRSAAVESLAAACGYRAGLALTKGAIRAGGDTGRYRLPRMNVPAGLSETGMRIRMGWR
jgi:peptidoglycan/xylan/chitin deacetylase (PgdA/CDA1 family)